MKFKFIFAIFLISYFHRECVALDLSVKSAIIMDAHSNVLFEKSSELKVDPGSIAKTMSLYLIFRDLKSGRITTSNLYKVSKSATNIGGSRMFLREDQYVSIDDIINGIIVMSANDGAEVLAENFIPHDTLSREKFIADMNSTAIKLGLKNSHFANSMGFPDRKEYMTCKDMVLLGAKIYKDFPDKISLFKRKNFIYNDIKQKNRNLLLWRDARVDGIKTSYTEKAGYGLLFSVQENGIRMFAALNGARDRSSLFHDAELLIEHGFSKYIHKEIFGNSKIVEKVPVYSGVSKYVDVIARDSVKVSYFAKFENKIRIVLKCPNIVKAPIKKWEKIGVISVQIPHHKEIVIDAIARKAVQQAPMYIRIYSAIREFFHHMMQ